MATDRVRDTIELTSPTGKQFSANWIGNKQSFSKKLGIYNYPKVTGTVLEDLGTTGDTYPMDLLFDGPGYDVTADEFFEACRETGKWEIIHPTKGFLGLQLMSVDKNDQPVKSANLTIVNTKWMEYIDPATLKTAAQLAALSGAILNEFNEGAADRFNSKARTDKFGDREAIIASSRSIADIANSILGPIAAANDKVASRFLDAQRGLQNTLDATVLQPLKIAGQIQEIMQLPGDAVADTRARLNAYKNLAAEIFGLSDDSSDSAAYNVAHTKEVSLSAVIGSLGIIANTSVGGTGTGNIQTQAQGIEAIEAIADQFSDITDNLDADQEKFTDDTIDDQYFSQTSTYRSAITLIANAQDYLLTNFFNLKTEKRYRLLQDRKPIDLTIEEYGSLGENDELLDLFLLTNEIKGEENFLIQQGRQVVFYV